MENINHNENIILNNLSLRKDETHNRQTQNNSDKEKQIIQVEMNKNETDQNRGKKESTTKTKAEIPIIPYNGKSPYLISKIFIIGYDHIYLKKLICKRNKEILKTTNKQILENELSFDYIILGKPEVLKIFSLQNCSSLDNSTIINFIFLVDPKIFITTSTKPLMITRKNIIFSFNIPLANNTKSSQNYYAYLHYEKQIVFNEIYYCPKVICYLSEYPYFINYHLLSHYYFQSEISQSISKTKALDDLWFYHLVNLPSPINTSYQLYYFPTTEIHLEANKPIIFNQLSGYPLIQFNLSELFNILPVDIIIQIFLFSFLEQDIFFFTENLEVLNIVMYIFYNLNYPLNDSSYFFQVVSLSVDSLKEGNNPYLTKTFSSMIGIKASYDESINQYISHQYYFIVDIEKKEMIFKSKGLVELNEDIVDIIKLKEYFDQVMRADNKPNINSNSNRNKNKNRMINDAIYDLFIELKTFSTMITHKNIQKWNGFDYPNFFTSDLELVNNNMNRSIQEKCYYFIIRVLSSFSPLFSLEYPNENKKNVFDISYNKNKRNSSMNKQDQQYFERLFLQKFSECSKSNTYIFNFILNNDCFDVLKIPLLFTEEFIYQYFCDETKTKTNLLFDAIDRCYHLNREIIAEIHLEYYFNCFNNILSKHAYKTSNSYDLIKYIQYEISIKGKKNQEIQSQDIFKYINYFKNKPNLAKESFSNNIKNNNSSSKLKQIPLNNLELIFEKYSMQFTNDYSLNTKINEYPSIIQKQVEAKILKENQMSRNEIIFISFILLFIVTKQHYNNDLKQLNMIIKLLIAKKKYPSVRKSITLLIILYMKRIKQMKTKGECFDIEKKGLALLIVSLKELKCLPNEELLLLLNNAYKHEFITLHDLINNSENIVTNKIEKKINDKSNINPKCHLKYNIGRNVYKEDYFLRLAENTQCVGNLFIEEIVETNESDENLNINKEVKIRTYPNVKWLVQHRNKQHLTHLFSPLKIYNLLREMVDETLGDNIKDDNQIEAEKMNHICCNLIFYILNIKEIFNNQENTTETNSDQISKNMNEYLGFLYYIIDKA